MRNTIIIIIGIVLLATIAFAQQVVVGCCCDPVLRNGSLSPQVDCALKNFIFIPNVLPPCGQHCQALPGPQPQPACGDSICQAGENEQNCPQDCRAAAAGCGSPIFKPAPEQFNVSSVRGQKALQLTFTLPCPTNYVNISRCKGTNCQNFKTIASIPPTTVFVDDDSDLEFNTDYTYSIRAYYHISGMSGDAISVGNAGDLECWHHQDETFCLSDFAYAAFHDYLTKFGYGQFAAQAFSSSFGRTVNQSFANRYNKAWTCNQANRLEEPTPRIACNAQQNEFCVSDENGARCARKEPCGIFAPFGLFATPNTCEFNNLIPRYCFFDKSTTVQNSCYSCDPRMTCYDYKSASACQRDNCGVGACQWKPTFSDVGSGVCVDTRYNNCQLCDKNGTGIATTRIANAIWDACTEEKSNALTTARYPCFYDKDQRRGKTCDEATCTDYSQIQCGSPSNGIRLSLDNAVVARSTDPCNIGVCDFNIATGCVKNADGGARGFADCAFGDARCEEDYFTPSTALIPSGQAGRIDLIGIRIFDKINKTSNPLDYSGKTGYSTYLCIVNATQSCLDARTFPIITNATQLILKNTVLKDGIKPIGTFASGNNTLRYYSRDKANNLEIVKELSIYSCDNCNGPVVLNLTVSGGRIIGKTIYTSVLRPTFRIEFDEPSEATYALISNATESIGLTQLTPGARLSHEFATASDLRGIFNFTFNAHNNKNIYIDPAPAYTLVIDSALADVNVYPFDGQIFNQSSIDVQLNFTKPVTLTKVIFAHDSFNDPYAKLPTERDITSYLRTNNNQTFTARIGNLSGGAYAFIVRAQSYNGLELFSQTSFFVSTQKPTIRLIAPSFGTTPYAVFNSTVETPLPSNCTYVYDTPSPPSANDFAFFKPFSGLGTIHSARGFEIPFGSERDYPLHVYCSLEQFGVIQRTFNLTLDSEPVRIIEAFSEPSVIAEQYIPGQELYSTTLRVQLSKPGFCKYSTITSTYPQMEGSFPGIDLLPKQSLIADVNVTEKKNYEYYITCKGKNGLYSQPVRVPFSIDLNLPLAVKSNTPIGFSNTNITIGVVANKRVYCYFGEQSDDTTRCMGACTSAYAQAQKIVVPQQGSYIYYVKCAHVGGEQSNVIDIPVIVDTTGPIMDYVRDDSSLSDEPDISWSQNRIRVAFKATDAESNISHYLITLRSQTDNQVIFRDYVSNVTNGEPIYISQTTNGSAFRLTNNKRYKFIVTAVNRVGTRSEPMESDGVLIDTSRTPEPCFDGIKNEGETDVDCGGLCDGCPENKACEKNQDCATNYCEDNVCKTASCEDNIQNGLETDIDCGGETCTPCEKGQYCFTRSDCSTNYCDLRTNTCEDAPPCDDQQLSSGESDIDCGGPCEACGDGKTCSEQTDCSEGLNCDPQIKTCTTKPVGDEDHDGIKDDVDACLGTPLAESIDEKGCSQSQTYSLGDAIHDKWRLDHFGCIDCPEAALDSDPDKDSLTNLEEFNLGTNPKSKDTDRDGWNDTSELDAKTDPLDATSHPPSFIGSALKVLFVLLALGGIVIGIYLALQKKRTEEPIQRAETRPLLVPEKELKRNELEQLKTFAKEEELEDTDWISLEKEIKKKPLTPKKFATALERLRHIAREKETTRGPLQKLRAILDELSSDERTELLHRFKLLQSGLLSSSEIQELFKRLKITADYYSEHKQELQKELERYGKRKH